MKNKLYFISILFVAAISVASLFGVAVPANADDVWVYPDGYTYPVGDYTSCGSACSSYNWVYDYSYPYTSTPTYTDYYPTTYDYYTPTYTYTPDYSYYYTPTYTYTPPPTYTYTPPPTTTYVHQPTCSISASPNNAQAGTPVTLSWSSNYATSATISNVGSVAVSGSRTVNPGGTTNYVMTVTGDEGYTATCQTTVVVQQPQQPSCTISASPSNVNAGDSVYLNWNSQNATSVSITNVGSVATSGYRTVNPSGTTTYVATVTGQGGSATCQTTVTVNQVQQPSCNLSVSNVSGNSAILTWNTNNATSAYIDQNVGNVNTGSGSRTVYPNGSGSTTYTMNVSGQGGSATCQATTYVQAQQPSCNLYLSPNNVNQGNSATLTWNTNNATSVTIDHGIGNVNTGNGSRTVNPSYSTTYTATAYGSNGQSVTCQATLSVNNQSYQPWCTITASQNSVGYNQNTVLQWNTSSNATSFYISPNVGSVNTGSGSRTVYQNTTTTYTGTVYGPNGQTATCQTTVGVYAANTTPTLYQQPGDQPLAFVSLSQVPYTGFEAGPVVTFIFWLMVAVWSFGLAYIFLGARGLQFIASRAFGYKPATVHYATAAIAAPAPLDMGTREDEYVNGFASAPAAEPAVAPVSQDLRATLEGMANSAGVLLSPEAANLALSLGANDEESRARFSEIVNEAVQTLPREDGWVLLSSDRFEDLAAKYQEAPEISADDLSV